MTSSPSCSRPSNAPTRWWRSRRGPSTRSRGGSPTAKEGSLARDDPTWISLDGSSTARSITVPRPKSWGPSRSSSPGSTPGPRLRCSSSGVAVVLVLISFAVVACYRFAPVARRGDPLPGNPPVAHHAGITLGLAIWTVWPLAAAAVVACVLVVALSWWLSESTNDKVRDGVRSALEAVHRSTARSVDDWLASISQEAGAWAQSPMVRDLLARPATSASRASTTEQVRAQLSPLRQVPGVAGY